MRWFRRPSLRIAIALVFVTSTLPAGRVEAASGLTSIFWSGSGFTVSTSTHAYSNATAFWQTILNSTNACVIVNGIFGSQTQAMTINRQQTWNSYNPSFPNILPADGVVNTNDWNGMQFSKTPPNNQGGDSYYRHQYYGYTNGYATEYWTYYGGGAFEALMGWNAFVPNWYLNPYPVSQAGWSSGWSLFPASASRTIGSYSCSA